MTGAATTYLQISGYLEILWAPALTFTYAMSADFGLQGSAFGEDFLPDPCLKSGLAAALIIGLVFLFASGLLVFTYASSYNLHTTRTPTVFPLFTEVVHFIALYLVFLPAAWSTCGFRGAYVLFLIVGLLSLANIAVLIYLWSRPLPSIKKIT